MSSFSKISLKALQNLNFLLTLSIPFQIINFNPLACDRLIIIDRKFALKKEKRGRKNLKKLHDNHGKKKFLSFSRTVSRYQIYLSLMCSISIYSALLI